MPTRNGASDSVEHLRGMFAFALFEMPQGKNGPPRPGVPGARPSGHQAALLRRWRMARCCSPPKCAPARQRADSSRGFRPRLPSYLLVRLRRRADDTGGRSFLAAARPFSMCISAQRDLARSEPMPYWDLATEFGAKRRRECAERRLRLSGRTVRAAAGGSRAQPSDRRCAARHFSEQRSGFDGARRARQPRAKRLHTFTVAFPDAEFSEADLARKRPNGWEPNIANCACPAMICSAARRGRCSARPAQHGRRQYVFRFLGGAAGGTEGGALRLGRRRSLRRLSHVPHHAARSTTIAPGAQIRSRARWRAYLARAGCRTLAA